MGFRGVFVSGVKRRRSLNSSRRESRPVEPADFQRENLSRIEPVPSAETRLVAQLRRGNSGAMHRFCGEYYPSVYRYLLWLTGSPETAEDLTQETFVRAWQHLDG